VIPGVADFRAVYWRRRDSESAQKPKKIRARYGLIAIARARRQGNNNENE
jgi:hypothetical protein